MRLGASPGSYAFNAGRTNRALGICELANVATATPHSKTLRRCVFGLRTYSAGMTPGETASEKKRSRSYWGFGLIGAVVIVAVALIFWPRAGGEQPLSLTVLGHSTNYWDYPVNAHFRLVFAYVAV